MRPVRLLTDHRKSLGQGLLLGGILWLVDMVLHQIATGDPLHVDSSTSAIGLTDLAFFMILGVSIVLMIDGRRRTADELRKLSRAVEQSPSTVMITDLKGRIEYVNPKFTALTGYTLEEVRGQGSNLLKSGETPPEEYTRLWRTIAAGQEWRGEFHNVKKNGEMYWESALISPIRSGSRAVTHYLAVKEDITARKAAEAAEREQRAFSEVVSEITAVLNSTLDFDQVLQRILAYASRVVAHDVASIMLIEDGVTRVVSSHDNSGRNRDTWPHVLRLRIEDTPDMRRVVETRRPHVISDTRRAPDWIDFAEADWIRSCALMPILNDGKTIGLLELDSATPGFFKLEDAGRLNVFADQVAVAIRNARMYALLQAHAGQLEARVTERTTQLEQERAQFRAILDSINEGVVYLEQGEIRFVNRALAAMLGYAERDFPLTTSDAHRLFLHGDDSQSALRAEVERDLHSTGVWNRQIVVHHKDGHKLDIDLTVTSVYGPDGRTIGSAAVLRDISDEREMHERRDRFLTHAAHELRTPLANLKMRLYLLRRQPDQIDQHLHALDTVATGMTQLVEDILDVLRLGRGAVALERSETDLRTVVNAVVTRHQDDAARRGVTLSFTPPEQPLVMCIDTRRMEQALTRLLSYAIYGTPEEGSVCVTLEQPEHTDDLAAVLRVCDGSDGVPEKDRDRIFEPFYHASEGDNAQRGLGLALAREIIRLHDGAIVIEDNPGCGMTLVVTLRSDGACRDSLQ